MKFNIGDGVIITDMHNNWFGIIKKYEPEYDQYLISILHYPGQSVRKISKRDEFFNSFWFRKDEFKLDIQYLREEKLKKLLNE